MLEDAARRWFEFSNRSTEPFERFVGLWLTLVLVSRLNSPNPHEENDIEVVKSWFLGRDSSVIAALKKHAGAVNFLKSRTGTSTGLSIIDVDGLNPKQKRNRRLRVDSLAVWLNAGWENSAVVPPGLVDVLIIVRNNLLHGRKFQSEDSDRRLVENLVILLKEILCEAAPEVQPVAQRC